MKTKREADASCKDLAKTQIPTNSPYREAVSSLLYLVSTTRPNISYTVNVLSSHQLDLKESDWLMVKRVFRYLIGTKSLSLQYKGESDELMGFADAKISITTAGFLVRLFGDTICWKTRKQKYVALATRDSEYVPMSNAAQEMLSIYSSLRLVLGISDRLLPMNLWCDYKAAVASAETNGKNKVRNLIEIEEHSIEECVARELIKLEWVRSREQLTDVFTKPLGENFHYELVYKILNNNTNGNHVSVSD